MLDPETISELAQALAPETPPPELHRRVLRRIQDQSRDVVVRESGGEWRAVSPGVTVKPLFYDRGAHMVAFLLRAELDVSFEVHGHRAGEECLVLEGEFTIGEQQLHAGDFVAAPAGTEHPAAYTKTGMLLYLRASADDYPYGRP